MDRAHATKNQPPARAQRAHAAQSTSLSVRNAARAARTAAGTRRARHAPGAASTRRTCAGTPPAARHATARAQHVGRGRRRGAARRGPVTNSSRAHRAARCSREAPAQPNGSCQDNADAGVGGSTRPPTHSAHAARACSSTHRRGKILRAISTRWNDGCRRTALHSLPPPSPDTDGPQTGRGRALHSRRWPRFKRYSSAACAGGAVRGRASARERRGTSGSRHARRRTQPRRKFASRCPVLSNDLDRCGHSRGLN